MRFELFIASRYLRAKRKQAFISVISIFSILGVAVGVCSLIVSMSIMNGFSLDLRDKILGANAHIVVHSTRGGMTDYAADMDVIRNTPGVKGVTPFLYTECMASNRNGAKGLMVRGIDPASAPSVLGVLDKLVDGDAQSLAGDFNPASEGQDAARAPGIIIGKELASQLGLEIGSRLYLLSPSGQRSSAGFNPSTKTFRVSGIFDTGMHAYDTTLAFISLAAGADLTGMPPGWISGLEVAVTDVYKADRIASELENKLGGNYVAKNWMQNNANLFAALKLEKIAMGIVLTLIVLVGSFSIVATLVMLVMEKTKDIAVMMAMGATPKTIGRIFTLQGCIIGVLGTALGAILGLGINFLITKFPIDLPPGVYSTNHVPVILQLSDFFLICGGAIFICCLATLYPASKASGLNPVEALHYE